MKKFLKVFFVVTLIFYLPVINAFGADPAKIIFCKGISEKWEPIEPASEFTTNSVSWLYTSNKRFGAPQIMVSIYISEKNSVKLLFRTNVDVDPNWGALGVKDMTFPSPGQYTLSFTSLSGDPIASGTVKIIEKKVAEKPFEEQKKMEGTTLEAIFNKYKPKS